jgi:predicted transcriptional regulator
MSTKATIAYGPTFHFYHEVFDESYVYLELEQVQFEASYNRMMVPIPVHIWEVIRQHPGLDLSLAEKTDDAIRAEVTQAVDERLQEYAAADEKSRSWIALSGLMVFGSVETPRDEQIAAGVSYYTERRAHQRQVIQAVDELRQKNRVVAATT